MDRNLLLAFALSFLVLTTWSMWQEAQVELLPPGEIEEISPDRSLDDFESVPEMGELAEEGFPALPPSAEAPPVFEETPDELVSEGVGISVSSEQPLYRVVFNTVGARIQRWELEEYTDKRGARVVLLDETIGGGALTPFSNLGLGNLATAVWQMKVDDPDRVVFELDRAGVRLRKSYVMDPDSYVIRVRLDVENESASSVEPRFELRWPAREREGSDFVEQSLVVLHNAEVETELLAGLGKGGWFSSGDTREYPFNGEVDWIGSQTPYFLSAVFPDSPSQASGRFVVTKPQVSGVAESFFTAEQVPPGQSATREYRIYAGPKESKRLEALGSGADKAVDLGFAWMAPLTGFFAWALEVLYSFVGNYGVAIIALTFLVRVVTTPLTMKQMKSMERMRALQPKVKELQEKYADDRPKQSEEMMALYRREKVNPLGGCLPLLLQMPVFIGLFYALRSSVALRQAPFFGWMDDLSAPEELFVIPGIGLPFRVLPVLMALSMVVQQKITPMQADPAQAKMMMTIMPVMMLVLFYQFPSGLVLYWMVSNVLAIAHQLYVGRGLKKS
jgi:YidC/Oxa1 family membrane protein insertase